DVRRVVEQTAHVELRGVEELLARGSTEDRLDVVDLALDPAVGLQHLGLGRLQNAVQATQHDQRKADSAVLGLLVVATQQVRDGPDERGVVLDARLRHDGLSSSAGHREGIAWGKAIVPKQRSMASQGFGPPVGPRWPS